MNYSIFTPKEYAHILNTIPEEFYQEIAANEERKTPEERKEEFNKLKTETAKWKNNLEQNQKELLDKLTQTEKEGENEKTLLNKINEDIHLNKKITDSRKEEVKKIDALFENAPTLDQGTLIQKPISDFENLLSEVNFELPAWSPAKQQQEKDAKEVLKKLDEGQAIKELGYLTGKLEKGSGLEESYLEITIPEGTRGIYLGTPESPELLLNRDIPLYITERSVFKNDKGDDTTKLTGKLLPKVEKNDALDFQTKEKDAKEWGQDKYKNWQKSLTRSPGGIDLGRNITQDQASKYEWEAIRYYSSQEYTKVNAYLRESRTNDSALDKIIQQIDSGLNKAETPETVHVYRRVSEPAFGLEKGSLTTNGKLVKEKVEKFIKEFNHTTRLEKAYMSTALFNKLTGLFAKENPILIRLTVPKGTHAAFLGGVAKLNEGELLLARGSSYKINSIEKKADKLGREYLQIEATLIN